MTPEEFRHDWRPICCESPDRRGSRGRLRLSGRRGSSDLRLAVQAEPAAPQSWCARAGRLCIAAEGYARSTGRSASVLVTSGPGATNAVTGLTDALMIPFRSSA